MQSHSEIYKTLGKATVYIGSCKQKLNTKSSTEGTWNLNVRYYFVTDQIKKGHLKVEFCPMQDMLVDFFNYKGCTLYLCVRKF